MTTDTAYFLGIDGGGSGCRAALADDGGRVLARVAGGGANIMTDPAGARQAILGVARAALDAVPGVSADIGDLRVAMGLAGANVPGAAARFRADLPFGRVRVDSDVVIALAGAHGAADGIVASLGTGAVYASQRAGVLRMVGGWGFVLGDGGSGAALGRAVLARALECVDGFCAVTPLLADLLAEFGSPGQMVEFAQSAPPASFARFAPRVIAAAAVGDPEAGRIVDDAVAQVARGIDLLLGAEPVPVSFLGGLNALYAARLAPRYGHLIRPPQGTPLDGALMLARTL